MWPGTSYTRASVSSSVFLFHSDFGKILSKIPNVWLNGDSAVTHGDQGQPLGGEGSESTWLDTRSWRAGGMRPLCTPQGGGSKSVLRCPFSLDSPSHTPNPTGSKRTREPAGTAHGCQSSEAWRRVEKGQGWNWRSKEPPCGLWSIFLTWSRLAFKRYRLCGLGHATAPLWAFSSLLPKNGDNNASFCGIVFRVTWG